MIAALVATIAALLLVAAMIRWRAPFSCEGIGLCLFLLTIGGDFVGTLWNAFLSGYVVDFRSEMELRAWPVVVALMGLAALAAGLAVGDLGRPARNPQISDKFRRSLGRAGAFLAVLGMGMKAYALYSWGFTSLVDYLTHIYDYDVSKHGGGFLDYGLHIALLGMSLMIVGQGRNRLRQLLTLGAMAASAFVLSTSKSGINTALLICLLTFAMYDRDLLRVALRPAMLSVAACVFFVGLGIKTQIKYGVSKDGGAVATSWDAIYDSATTTISRRYGAYGNYRGYCNLVNRMTQDRGLFFNGAVIVDVATSWIPRFVWPAKPEHPFHAKGYLVNDDFSIDDYGNDAPTLIGFAFADNGLASTVLYLFAGGLVLGFLRRFALRSRASPAISAAYLFFSAQLGTSLAETGFLSLIYYLIFSVGVGLAIEFFFVFMRIAAANEDTSSALTAPVSETAAV